MDNQTDAIYILEDTLESKPFPEFEDRYREDFWEQYRPIQELGHGEFGTVWLISDIETGEKFALKLYDRRLDADTEKEIEILTILSKQPDCQPGIVCYYDRYYVPDIEDLGTILPAVLMQYVEGDRLDTFGTDTDEDTLLEILNSGLRALMYMHSYDVAHRDIKPENIIIKNAFDERKLQTVLIDFGISCQINNRQLSCNTIVGSYAYISTDVLSGRVLDDKSLWKRSDIYSLGASLYQVISGKEPDWVKRKGFGKVKFDESLQLDRLATNLNPERTIDKIVIELLINTPEDAMLAMHLALEME